MRLPISLSVLLVAAISNGASAKPPTWKLIVTGGDLAGMVELTDSATLALSDVFTGNFLDTSRGIAPAPGDLPQYEISFYLPGTRFPALVRLFRPPRLDRAYVVRFAYNATTRTGYVYVPGRGDVWADWNRGTIVRANEEGRWVFADGAWTHRLAEALARARRRPAPSCERQRNASSGPLLFHPGDSLYSTILEFTKALQRGGLDVLCAYQSTFDGTLGRRAAGIMTSRGPLAVVFFSSAADASTVVISATVRRGVPLTVLRRGSAGPLAVDSISGAEPATIFIHGRWLIDAFGQYDLAQALRRVLSGSAP